ncbi:hypothetical protein FVE85_7324 [Porphyridium purpureum]|uniref:Uncharacterized protein n=1 Tax=Porphyridium purpureum TaxID=35688 RepID=A0A5J4Z6U9_PORPP|nr:hypothetical protein FVE85_7324 [Porphyridium purpureum]|eukprot:POR2950..scf295_1
MQKLVELKSCVETIENDTTKFYSNGNKAAGTRARKHLQELKQLAQELRVAIQETKAHRLQTDDSSSVPQHLQPHQLPPQQHMMAPQHHPQMMAPHDVSFVGYE